MRLVAHNQHNRVIAAFWRVMGFNCCTWLGNPFGIPLDSAINPIPDLLNSGIFIGILFF
jgi:hypothetical protein